MENDECLKSIDNPEALYSFLQRKAKNHNCYKIYATTKTIEEIIKSQSLLFDDGDGWNDNTDKKHMKAGEKGKRIFARCFSFSKSENVAMWMLYGGRGKNGALINFNRKAINNLLAAQEITLCKRSEGFISEIKTINCGDDKCPFRIYISDILYTYNKNGEVDLKRSDERVHRDENILQNMPPYLQKQYPWSYENEVRMILEIDENLVPVETNCVKISFADTSGKSKTSDSLYYIYRAPNAEKHVGYKESTLKGDIDWDLCKNGCDHLPATKTSEVV